MSKEKKIWKMRRENNGRGDSLKNIWKDRNEKKALKWLVLKVGRKWKNDHCRCDWNVNVLKWCYVQCSKKQSSVNRKHYCKQSTFDITNYS
jgi:hypothetical protein